MLRCLQMYLPQHSRNYYLHKRSNIKTEYVDIIITDMARTSHFN
jgi:hypothetical protein